MWKGWIWKQKSKSLNITYKVSIHDQILSLLIENISLKATKHKKLVKSFGKRLGLGQLKLDQGMVLRIGMMEKTKQGH
jgi:hypothetical protein